MPLVSSVGGKVQSPQFFSANSNGFLWSGIVLFGLYSPVFRQKNNVGNKASILHRNKKSSHLHLREDFERLIYTDVIIRHLATPWQTSFNSNPLHKLDLWLY
jgi:hypothetical protein